MTPSDLTRGDYKLNVWLRNPNGQPREMDWRLKEQWEAGTRFHCAMCYYDGREIPAVYIGNYPRYIHRYSYPELFELIVPHLEKV